MRRQARYAPVDAPPDAVFVVDPSGRFLEANPAAVAALGHGRDTLLAMSLADVDPALDLSQINLRLLEGPRGERSALSSAPELGGERTGLPEVSTRWIDHQGQPALLVVAQPRDLRGITEELEPLREEPAPDAAAREADRKRREDQACVAQRLAAVGRLAGGVAHDLNNFMTVILGFADIVIADMPADSPHRRDLDEIVGAAERAAALTRQLLAFGRRQVLMPVVVSVNRIVADMENMLRRLLGEGVDLVVRLAADLGNVSADVTQIEQVLLNLCANARDAMPDGGGLVITTANVELDEEYASVHAGSQPGSYVVLSVTDTGCGMDAQTQARIFEPFFSTKAPGKGTGLGLATTYGIVKQSGGSIWVYSEPGRGTTFRIYLPRVLGDCAVVTPPTTSARPATCDATVLVVEDEDAVRRAEQRILRAAGYQVIPAADGNEALRLCQDSLLDIHLVLTDLVMPKMGGRVLATRLAALRPGVQILFTSGHAEDALAGGGVLEQGAHFISKPFTAAELTRKIREVLDGADGKL